MDAGTRLSLGQSLAQVGLAFASFLQLSGSRSKMNKNKGVYSQLLTKHRDQSTASTQQIERDLTRTFVGNPLLGVSIVFYVFGVALSQFADFIFADTRNVGLLAARAECLLFL